MPISVVGFVTKSPSVTDAPLEPPFLPRAFLRRCDASCVARNVALKSLILSEGRDAAMAGAKAEEGDRLRRALVSK